MREALGRLFWKFVHGRLARRDLTIASSGFYSPLVNVPEVAADRDRLWPATRPTCAGVDFNRDGLEALIFGPMSRLAGEFDYGTRGEPDAELTRFYDGNSQFASTDARALFALLRLWKPARIIEIGSGYSTLLMADVMARFLPGTRLTAIEPYPRAFLRNLGQRDGIELIEKRVQRVDPGLFQQLESGDILFIDSSHVAKTGSDVNVLVFDVLPQLRPGVHIHFHDIFLPFEYPEQWVMDDHRSWSEQYLVRALLMYARDTFRITFGSAFALSEFADMPASLTGATGATGGSLWLTKIA